MDLSDIDLPDGVPVHHHATAAQMAESMADQVAEALSQAIRQRGRATLVVSGGRSPVAFFEVLARRELPWANVLISLADERWVAPEQPGSNEALVRRHLLQGKASAARFIALYSVADCLEQAAERADVACAELLPIDVLVLGMGDDGHTASLFPGSPLLAQALDPSCIRRVLPMQALVEPRERLSLTRPVLASARLALLAIQGEAKLRVLQAASKPGAECELPIRVFLRPPLRVHWTN